MSSPEHEPDPQEKAGTRDLTVGSIPRHLLAFSLPMLAGSTLQVAYSLVNAVWVGRFLGPIPFAAVSAAQPVLYILFASAAGLTLSGNILVAQDVGAHDWARLRRVVQTSYLLISGVSVLFLVAAQLLTGEMLQAMRVPANITPMAAGYLHIYLWTIPFIFWVFLISALLRGIGDSRTPVYFQTVSVLINAVLDPLLIFGLLGLPRLGVYGTAYATLFSQAVAVIGLIIYTVMKRPLVSPDLRRWRLEAAAAWLLLRIGVPAAMQNSVVSFSLFWLSRYVNGFGAETVAAFGVGLRIDGLAFLPAVTIGTAVSTLAGQNIGACQFGRVRQVYNWGMLLSVGISLLITLAAVSVPQLFVRAFTRDPHVVDLASTYLRIVGYTYFLYAATFVANGVINGAGQTLITTLFAIIALWLIRLPLAGYLAATMGRVTGVWDAMLISVAAGTLLSLGYYYTGKWRQAISNAVEWKEE